MKNTIDHVIFELGCSSENREKALALAIVLRDRMEAVEETARDFTGCILAGMLVEYLEAATEEVIISRLSKLATADNQLIEEVS